MLSTKSNLKQKCIVYLITSWVQEGGEVEEVGEDEGVVGLIDWFQEYLKEKKRKKQEKMKELLEAKEKEKGKWQNFSTKEQFYLN